MGRYLSRAVLGMDNLGWRGNAKATMKFTDVVNGLFEFGGSIAVWYNVWALYRDKHYAGCRIAPSLFFAGFSAWNLYFYPSLNQMWSTIGGASLAAANIAYIVLMLKYKKE